MHGPDPPSNSTPEAALESLEQIFNKYYRAVLAFLCNKGLSREDARDLAQETFLRVHQGLSAFRGDSSVETWVFSIALNELKNARRRLATGKRQGITLSIDDNKPHPSNRSLIESPEKNVLQDERLECLRDAIQDVPPKMQQILKLRLFQDLAPKDIAIIQGVTPETVRSTLSQAQARLRQSLKRRFPELDL